MDCKKVKEELVFLACDHDQDLRQEIKVAFEHHLSQCPECARKAQVTHTVLTIVRTRAVRVCAPNRLRFKILDRLQDDGTSH